jgi:DNA-binding NarL/FixJ family response regulator
VIASWARLRYYRRMAEDFVRHKQAWTSDEVAKLRRFAEKGMAVRAIAKALTRSEESVKARAKEESLKLAKLR